MSFLFCNLFAVEFNVQDINLAFFKKVKLDFSGIMYHLCTLLCSLERPQLPFSVTFQLPFQLPSYLSDFSFFSN